MPNNPRRPGKEPDPDSTSPNDDLPGNFPSEGETEHIEEDGEPLGGNFA